MPITLANSFWSTILWPSGCKPATEIVSIISVRVTRLPPIRYALIPLSSTSRLIVTSSASIGNWRSTLSNTMPTRQIFAGELSVPPLNSREAKFSARSDLLLNLPNTKSTASRMLLFPPPFSPTMAVNPLARCIVVFRGPKLLNPCIVICRMKATQTTPIHLLLDY